jgi:uncharacterized C2H2 Zn-finger protein
VAVEVKCPTCEDVFRVGESEAAGEIECPACGTLFRRSQKKRRAPKRRSKLFSKAIAGVIVAGAVILVIYVISRGGLLGMRNEHFAVENLKKIAFAQEARKEMYGNYASLQGLRKERLIPADLSYAEPGGPAKWGYYYAVDFDRGEAWICIAYPEIPGVTGKYSYYIDQTGVIREAPCENEDDSPAGQYSPPLK